MIHIKNIVTVIIPAFLIGLLFVVPFVVADELYNGIIVAKEFWFFGVVAAMLLYWAIAFWFNREVIKISLNITDILLLTFYAWCFIRAIFTPYTPFWHNHKLQVLTGMMVVYFFVRNAIKIESVESKEEINTTKSFILPFIIFLFILSGLLQAIYGLLQLYGICPSHHNLFKITGSFFNPAPYALYLAVVFPVALGRVLFTFQTRLPAGRFSHLQIFKFSYYLSFATVITILLVLPVTMIRASWIGALAGSLVVLQYKYHYLQQIKKFLNNSFMKILAVLLMLGVIALLGAGVYYLKKDSANGKLFIWEVTLGKVAEKPLFGHGLGRFEAEYNNWQAEYFQNHPDEMYGKKGWVAGNTKYAFNDYLEMMSEIGLPGVILFILVFLGTLSSNLRLNESWKSKYGGRNHMKLALSKEVSLILPQIQLISALFSILMIMHISYPLYNLAILLPLFLIAGILSSGKEEFFVRLPMALLRVFIPIISIGVIIIGDNFWKEKKAYNQWRNAVYEYKMSNYSNANEIFRAVFSKLKYNGSLLQQYGKSLQLSGNNPESIKILNQASKYTCDYILYCNLGDSYKATKQYKDAEEAYLKAVFMNPHKLQPHYQLAKLYEQNNDKERAVLKAREIINQKVKIESFSVERIRSEMEKILANDHN